MRHLTVQLLRSRKTVEPPWYCIFSFLGLSLDLATLVVVKGSRHLLARVKAKSTCGGGPLVYKTRRLLNRQQLEHHGSRRYLSYAPDPHP